MGGIEEWWGVLMIRLNLEEQYISGLNKLHSKHLAMDTLQEEYAAPSLRHSHSFPCFLLPTGRRI